MIGATLSCMALILRQSRVTTTGQQLLLESKSDNFRDTFRSAYHRTNGFRLEVVDRVAYLLHLCCGSPLKIILLLRFDRL